VVAQITTGSDGHTLDGAPAEQFTAELERAGADVIGVNCAVGPAAMLETIEAMAHVSGARLAAQPNAGAPREVDGRHLYLSSPDYMASYARRFITAGVRLVGGCCGTSPEHTRAIAEAVRAMRPAPRLTPAAHPAGPLEPTARLVRRRDKSALAHAMADGRFVAIAEVAAPRGTDLTSPVEQARRFRALGATAVTVPDYPKSGARASATAVAVRLAEAHVDPVLQFTCRDRTLLGMQSELVGLHALGVRDVLVTTGVSRRPGSHQDATPMFEVDAIGALNLVQRLNQGLDVGGQPFGTPAGFHVGATFNPFAPDAEVEWSRLAHKIQAGAEFLVTPPILDVEALAPALARLRDSGLPVIAGIAALEGVRHAEFLASEVVGVRVAPAVLDRLRGATDEAAEALALSVEIAQWLRERVQGLQITWVHGSCPAAERLLDALGRASVLGSPEAERAARG
jgi:homocysteine S-methyltransferase